MLQVFGGVKELVKVKHGAPYIDNNIFRLHYKATVIILLVFSLVVTATQYIGDPINCIVDKIPEKAMNSYCWIYSTFTIPNKLTGRIGMDVIQPGVGGHTDSDKVKYHKYYQWVCFVLFFQAMLFYMPRYLWKTWEGGIIKALATDVNCPIVSEETKNKQKKLLVEYFSANLHQQNFYAIRFFICEALNFINVVGQIYLMDVFLEGEFSRYGYDVVKFTEMEPELRADPMARVFPKVTKCTFTKYGPSGSLQSLDGLCVLPLNVVNEKIYVFLWFWFLLLSIVTGLAILQRIVVISIAPMRMHLLRSRARFGTCKEAELITNKCQIGDWFILYQLSRNINPIIYKELITDLARELESKEIRVSECKEIRELEIKEIV